MTPDQSKRLKVGHRVAWHDSATDQGTVIATDWSSVHIADAQRLPLQCRAAREFPYDGNRVGLCGIKIPLSAERTGNRRAFVAASVKLCLVIRTTGVLMFGFGAKAKCAKCGSTSFRLKPIELIDSEIPYNAVFCNKCGAPFAVIEDINVGAMLVVQKRQIAALGSKIDSMARQMDEIADAINHAPKPNQYR